MRNLFLEVAPANLVDEVVSVSGQFERNLRQIADTIWRNRGNIVWNLFLILMVLLLSKLILRSVSALTARVLKSPKYQSATPVSKRMKTLMTLLRSVARYAVYFVAFLVILSILGMGKPLENLLVTAGIGSLAIGFGAQNLVRDVVSGMFMIFENQFSVGDYVKIDDVEGTVEATAMRVTYLRSMKGDQIIIPNGTITRVINYNKGNSVAAVTIPTSYESDTRKVIELIDRAVSQYAREHEELIEEPPFVQGITNFNQSSIDIGILCKVKPLKHWEVERGIRLAVKEIFDQNGLSIPYPHLVTVPYEKPEEIVSKEDIFVEKGSEDQELAQWQSMDADDLSPQNEMKEQ